MKKIWVMFLVVAFPVFAETADDLRTKLQVNEQLKDAAITLLNKHAKVEQARKPGGRVKAYRDEINKLLDKMEEEYKKPADNPVARSQEIWPLKEKLNETIGKLEEELQFKPEKYEHELKLAINYFNESKKNMGKIAVLKENAAAVNAAEKVIANPKIEAAEVRKIYDASKK